MTLYTEGFSRPSRATAPIATGWSESCRVGLAHWKTVPLHGALQQPVKPIIEQKDDFHDAELREALVNLAANTLTEHPDIGAWLIQCSDFPPYSGAIATATGLPVFDMVALIGRLYAALVPRAWS